MFLAFAWILAPIVFAACVHAALMALQNYENQRFVRSRFRVVVPSLQRKQRAAVLAPCKGHDLNLAANLQALLNQDHPNYQVMFIVESQDDPAIPVIQSAMATSPKSDSRLIIAGQSHSCGQKVHNLRVAIQRLDPDIKILAFVDSDACPPRHWLRSLVYRITKKSRRSVAAVTGYRWMVPQNNSLANLLLYSLNSSSAGLMGCGRHMAIWGGSWAISRKVFESARILEAWDGTLSDDLVATAAMKTAKLRVHFEPRCVNASHVNMRFQEVWEFLRRQLLIGRRYAPRLWRIIFAAVAVSQIALWGSVAMGLGCVAGSRSGAMVWTTAALGLYMSMVIRGFCRQLPSKLYVASEHKRLWLARQFDIWLAPFSGLLLLAAFVASAFGDRICWRGIGYRIRPGGRIQLLERDGQRVEGAALEQTPDCPPPVRQPVAA